MDSSTWELIGAGALILILFGVAALIDLRNRRIFRGLITPKPKISLPGISKAEQQERAAFVLRQAHDLNQLPWGKQSISVRLEAERVFQNALDTIADAEGDYRKLAPVVDELLKLPKDLGLSGAARILMTLSFFRGDMFSPEGVQAALAFTSNAVNAEPLSVDAWIVRLHVATSVSDPMYGRIAKYAKKQIEKLNPNHPRYPSVESLYYRRYGTKQQYEASLRRMIDLAPSLSVKRAGYDRLAMSYATSGRLDEALATYQEYFRQDPEGSAWMWHNYSIFLLRAKRYREALDASDHALSFFEFKVARDINNAARKALGLTPDSSSIEVEG
jgi:tetratricopeptide (TPR) repeat protein